MHKVPTTECRQVILGFVPRSARTRAIAARTASLELSSADASEDRVAWSGTRVLTPCSSRWHVVRGMPALDASSVSVSPFVRRKSARLGSSPLPTSRAVTGSSTTFASLGMKRGWGCSRPCSQAPIRAPSATPTASATSLIVRPAFRRACLSAMPSTLLLATIRNPTGDTPSRGSSRYPCLSRAPPLQRSPDAWRTMPLEENRELAAFRCPSDGVLVAYMCESRLVRPGDGLRPIPSALGMEMA